MKAIKTTAIILIICMFNIVENAQAQQVHKTVDHIMVMPDNFNWIDGPVSLPPGAKKALLEGDPKDSGLFTMRLMLPAGYRIMPHRHTADEHVTVIEGSFYMGIGERFNENIMMQIPTGGFAVMLAGTAHYGFAKEACIIQVHGLGPWIVTYVNPDDDPRKKRSN